MAPTFNKIVSKVSEPYQSGEMSLNEAVETGGGELKKIANQSIIINSNRTGSIQETHKIIFHSICETFENI